MSMEICVYENLCVGCMERYRYRYLQYVVNDFFLGMYEIGGCV